MNNETLLYQTAVSSCSLHRTSYRCDLGLDPLPEGPRVVLVLRGQRVPHPDRVVADAQRQASRPHGREGQGVDEAAQRGEGPAAVQRAQVPTFHLQGNVRFEMSEQRLTESIR